MTSSLLPKLLWTLSQSSESSMWILNYFLRWFNEHSTYKLMLDGSIQKQLSVQKFMPLNPVRRQTLCSTPLHVVHFFTEFTWEGCAPSQHSFLLLYLQPDTTCCGRRTDLSSGGKRVWFFITFLRLSGWWRTQILKIHLRVCSLIYPRELYGSALFFFKSRITARAENDLSLFTMRAKWQWWTQLFPHCEPLIMSTKLVPLQGHNEEVFLSERKNLIRTAALWL